MPILNWLDRDKHVKAAEDVPYRLLVADDAHSAGDLQTENMVIQGDNMDAVKALLPYYAGKVKCIFIDPPYNTKSAFEHYDDNLEHSKWLGMMVPRLRLLRELLSEDGSIWVTIDDNEAHYLKVVMDEVFGRKNFLTSVMWNSRKSKQNDAKISLGHNHILIYAKNMTALRINRMAAEEAKFENPDNDHRGLWVADAFDAPQIRANLEYPIVNPNTGQKYLPPKGRHWRTTQQKYERLLKDGMIVFGKTGKSRPQQKRFLTHAVDKGVVPGTWWDDCGTAAEATKEIQAIFDKELTFDTPKPERLLHRILHLATNPGDLVLDSFLGSGTTAAVAHKMNRRYIGIETGDHALTHCVPRLKKVIEGEQGGISEAVGWKGGGGFRFYRLGEPVFDAEGRINPAIRIPHRAH